MIEKIKSLLLDKTGKIISGRVRINYLMRMGIYDFINESFDNTYSLSEKIYCITHNLIVRKRCVKCNKEIKFTHTYSKYCSRHCANNDPIVLEKNRMGVSKSLKQAYKERGDEIKEKRANTLFKNYGVKTCSPYKIPQVQDKIKNIIKDKFGVTNVFYLEKFRANADKTARNKSIKFNNLNGYNVEYLDKGKIKIKNLCETHGDIEMTCVNFYNRFHRNRKGIQCPICNPMGSFSSLELIFENLIKQIGITNYEKNTKKYINPYELDFYFPEHKIAIELNGIYWHSEIYKDKNYHKMKSDLCKEKGIQLIQIWEDDLYDKIALIKSMLSYKFNKNLMKLYARKCTIKEITSRTYREFLYKNHIQGSINSSIRYGLFYEKELVSVMGFGKLRTALGNKDKPETYELQRFCSKQNIHIIGGASKLFSYFLNNNKCKQITSYAKRDYSSGNLYLNLGFELDKICEPGFYWIIDGKRKHRYNYRKDKISNETNKELTSIEIMHNLGYIRCFDSGNLKYVKKIAVNSIE